MQSHEAYLKRAIEYPSNQENPAIHLLRLSLLIKTGILLWNR